MKKLFFVAAGAAVMLASCSSNKTEEENVPIPEAEKVISMMMDDPNFTQTPSEKVQKAEEDLSGKIIILDDNSFVAQVTDVDNPKGFQYKGNTPCLVDFYADWCRPCNAMHPILAEIANEYQGKLIVYKVNTDKSTKTAAAFNISSIPTMLLFKRNTQPMIINGAMPKEELKKAVDEYLAE